MGTSKYSPELRADAVALYHVSPDETYASMAKDLGITHETPRTGGRDAEHAARPGAVEATAMEKENRQLRVRVKGLELEREILRRAAKHFAAGTTSWWAAASSSSTITVAPSASSRCAGCCGSITCASSASSA